MPCHTIPYHTIPYRTIAYHCIPSYPSHPNTTQRNRSKHHPNPLRQSTHERTNQSPQLPSRASLRRDVQEAVQIQNSDPFKKYKRGRKLGEGASGTVYCVVPLSALPPPPPGRKLARSDGDKRGKGMPKPSALGGAAAAAAGAGGATGQKPVPCAMKCAPLSDLENLKNEIAMQTMSSHPNIVQYLESFAWKGKLWIVMEYMQGQYTHPLLCRAMRCDAMLHSNLLYSALPAGGCLTDVLGVGIKWPEAQYVIESGGDHRSHRTYPTPLLYPSLPSSTLLDPPRPFSLCLCLYLYLYLYLYPPTHPPTHPCTALRLCASRA